MKYFFLLSVALTTMMVTRGQEDKSKRASPPAIAKETLASGTTVSIDYSQPSVKGREIGKDLEPFEGKIWRAGANEATVFEVSKAVKINGMDLPAGKYALFMIAGAREWVIIFNKTWDQWGAFSYKQSDDALRISVKAGTASPAAEQLTYTISTAGMVNLLWGQYKIGFEVQ